MLHVDKNTTDFWLLEKGMSNSHQAMGDDWLISDAIGQPWRANNKKTSKNRQINGIMMPSDRLEASQSKGNPSAKSTILHRVTTITKARATILFCTTYEFISNNVWCVEVVLFYQMAAKNFYSRSTHFIQLSISRPLPPSIWIRKTYLWLVRLAPIDRNRFNMRCCSTVKGCATVKWRNEQRTGSQDR